MSNPPIRIPMLDLRAQHVGLETEIFEGFSAVLASGRFILGEAVEEFESDLAKLCDARFAIGCNSGTDALWLALRGMGIGPGDAVLCPAYSFFATAATIARIGAEPIFADINPASLNLDPADAIRRAESIDNLRAIISVDLFGRVCELGPLQDYCRRREIKIIQDAAQSIGALDRNGKRIGSNSDVACFSFYPTKNLGALGDAGGLVTDDAELARTISRLRVHGESEPGVYETIGINSRLDTLQAVALSVKMRHIESWIEARRRLSHRYDDLFLKNGATNPATHEKDPVETGADSFQKGSLPLLIPAPCPAPGRHTYHRYVVRVSAEKRAGLIKALAKEGIDSTIFYPRGLHQQPALASYARHTSLASNASWGPLIETERACRECLALPLYPELGEDQISEIVSVVVRFLSA